MKLKRLAVLPSLLLAFNQVSTATQETVFHDNFASMKVEMISAGVIGAEVEYHFLPEVAPRGNWEVSCFLSAGSQRAWRVLREDGFGRKFMYQASTSGREESSYTHPLLIAGDPLWADYTLSQIRPGEQAELERRRVPLPQ